MTAAIVDCETTGFKEPVPCEVAYLPLDLRGNELERGRLICNRYNPGKKIEYGAMAVHGISNRMVADSMPFDASSMPTFEYLIGHSVDYDWEALGRPTCRLICTLAIMRYLRPTLDSHSLGACVLALYGEERIGDLRAAHGAEADVEFCLEVLVWIQLYANPRPTSMEELWLLSELARIPTHMPFGKHRGLPIEQVPPDYKNWLLRQDDVDPYLRKALLG